ncbi:unnamed protein product [Peniophora sp. CBMAI 1063]|nr:unnamed protein product [Peniophora sp. CBMAI 1063]
MGITGLVRWTNAPTTGLELIRENIRRNLNGNFVERWQLSVRSYRSTLGALAPERSMCALTMGENVFVSIEDPFAPSRREYAANPEGYFQGRANRDPPPHYRHTFLTLSPPGALELLLGQLRARWMTTKQAVAQGQAARGPNAQQLVVDGLVWAIGTDWIVRAGNVVLNGVPRGMLLEAEYLPVPTMDLTKAQNLISSLLSIAVPNVRDARLTVVTISDEHWADALWNSDAEDTPSVQKPAPGVEETDEYCALRDDDEEMCQNDWVGVARDRRSAYLILGYSHAQKKKDVQFS